MKQFTQKCRKSLIQDILQILSVESVSNTPGIEACQTIILEIAKRLGFQTKLLGKGKVIVIESINAIPESIPELGIITHLDTVPINKTKWSYNPLGTIYNKRIFGRGVIDDKAAIILSLYAIYLLDNSIRPTWQIIVGSSEETEWTDMESYFEEGHPLPKFSINLDGDGVQNGCKGYLDLTVNFKRTSNQHNISDIFVPNGTNNMIPEKAIISLNNSFREYTGHPSHSSTPERGKNPLIELACDTHLSSISEEFLGFFKLMKILKTTYNAKAIGFFSSNNISGKQNLGITTVCPTTCRLRNNSLSVNLNFRIKPGTTEKDIVDFIKNFSKEFYCECSYDNFYLPTYVDTNTKEIELLLNSYEKYLCKSTLPTIANGIGYNTIFPNCVIFGPRFDSKHDEPDTSHSINENRKISDLFIFLRMLRHFIKVYLG